MYKYLHDINIDKYLLLLKKAPSGKADRVHLILECNELSI